MPTITKPNPGTFCWIELSTTDPGAAKKFYATLFAWGAAEVPMPDGSPYTIAKVGDNDAGGIRLLADEAKKMGAPPHWLSYVAVDSADDATARARKLGGKVLVEPFAAGDMGRMSILQDPTGGVFALWQPIKPMGTFLYAEVGALCWNELATSNVDAAGKFYTGLFGWKAEAYPMGETTYTMFKQGDTSVGGMMPMPKEMAGAPTAWTAYVAVSDCDATASQTRKLGGKVINPPTDIPNIGRFAILQDPQGAVIAAIKLVPTAK